MKLYWGAIFLFTLHTVSADQPPRPTPRQFERPDQSGFYGRYHNHNASPCVEVSNIVWTAFGIIIGSIIGVVIARLTEKKIHQFKQKQSF